MITQAMRDANATQPPSPQHSVYTPVPLSPKPQSPSQHSSEERHVSDKMVHSMKRLEDENVRLRSIVHDLLQQPGRRSPTGPHALDRRRSPQRCPPASDGCCCSHRCLQDGRHSPSCDGPWPVTVATSALAPVHKDSRRSPSGNESRKPSTAATPNSGLQAVSASQSRNQSADGRRRRRQSPGRQAEASAWSKSRSPRLGYVEDRIGPPPGTYTVPVGFGIPPEAPSRARKPRRPVTPTPGTDRKYEGALQRRRSQPKTSAWVRSGERDVHRRCTFTSKQATPYSLRDCWA
eukprot:NODE_190_length_1136_cov_277.058243_g187_i0.p1 GENE.NODE_190_length_1136_cov_277.058243_g187_i0~~NODE_190_length_1136_cov_277.058243_g187_i0.p1  ORF type:complete len:291 (+),score=16.49 NODE_190_length_1136_cov_277.058243_g187_i0:129-1001(+)